MICIKEKKLTFRLKWENGMYIKFVLRLDSELQSLNQSISLSSNSYKVVINICVQSCVHFTKNKLLLFIQSVNLIYLN